MTLSNDAEPVVPNGVVGLLRRLPRGALALAKGGSEGERTSRAAVIAFLIRVLSAGIAYVSQVLMARWMGSFEYGIFVFVWVWVLILGGLAPLGLSVSTIRYVAEYRETAQLALLRGLLADSRAIAIGVSTLVMAAGLGSLYLLGPLVESYFVLPALLILFCLPAYTLVDVQDGIARGFAWIDVALFAPYVLRPLLVLVAMAAAYAAGLPLTANVAASAAILACWAAAIVQTVTLHRRLREVVPRGPREHATRLWLLASLPLLLMHGFELLLQNTDILVLSHYAQPSELAVYFAALKTIALVSFVHFAVGTAAANRYSAYQARGDGERLQAFVRNSVRWTFWPTLAGAAGLLVLGRPLLWLFGPDFVAGYPLMFVLAIGLVVRAAVGPSEFILNMLGQQKACALALFMAAGLNLALNFALVPWLGLYGAAIATSISLAASSLFMFWVARRRLGLRILVGL